MLRRLALPALALALTGVVACGSGESNVGQDSDEVNGPARTIQINKLLEDSEVEGGANITAAQVQAFLESKKSGLVKYSEDGRKAAQWIVDESRAERISPLYMLARLETESSIITSGNLNRAKSACGCRCPDTAACDPQYASFGKQIRCSARDMRGYLTTLETRNKTVTGWGVGSTRSTLDGCKITPQNKVTAALYTYTPWVGAYGIGCGTPDVGGATLIPRLYSSYKAKFPAEDGAPTPTPAPAVDRNAEAFAKDVYPTLKETCAGCHQAGAGGAPVFFGSDAASTYALMKDRGFQKSPSPLLAKGAHAGPALGSEQLAFVETWLKGEGSQVQTPSPSTPRAECTRAGTFCGSNTLPGSPEELFRCDAGKISRLKVCERGCIAIPPGGEDACRP